MVESFCQGDASVTADKAFRPAKRRKFYRSRHNEDDGGTTLISPPQQPEPTVSLTLDELIINHGGTAAGSEVEEDDEPLSVAELLRLRKAAQRKRGGVEFSNSNGSGQNLPKSSQTNDLPLENDDAIANLEKVVNRFAPQTGQVANVDKHMMAYIDSELVKRREGQYDSTLYPNSSGFGGGLLRGSANDVVLNRQPAALGKLLEIDLGPDATLRNIAMTEAAKRRLEGGTEEVDEGTGKVRLRRDGRPFRGRRRRNSQDVKRDQLVEEVMRESRLEIYDEPEEDAGNDDQAADDRIAEQFRREFMEAISSRRHRTGPAVPTKATKGLKVDDKPKGPKLGGSRSARAAMRVQQEKAAKK